MSRLKNIYCVNKFGVTYEYDNSGNILSKTYYDYTVGSLEGLTGTSIQYGYNDSEWKDLLTSYNGNAITYDAAGTRHSMTYNGNTYYYYYNLQGDVIGLYDADLNVVVNYTYDSWGKVLSVTGSMASTLGQANPFRYRGYYYDEELGLYYLNSRYYDPEVGRFINADAYLSTGQGVLSYNMFAYCNNNPIMFVDPAGNSSISIFYEPLIKLVKETAEIIKRVAEKALIESYFKVPSSVDIDNLDSRLILRLYKMGNAHGIRSINITSGYRSNEKQDELYRKYLAGKGNYAAKPGTSWHNWGGAIDISCPKLQNLPDSEFKKFNLIRPVYSPQRETWHIQITETQNYSKEKRSDYFNSIVKWSEY